MASHSSFGCWVAAFVLLLVSQAGATDQVKLNPSGPDAERLGIAEGFPSCPGSLIKPECRVGTWSANEKDGLTDIVRALGNVMPLPLMR